MGARLTGSPGVHVVNDIVLNQVLVRFDGDSTRTADETTAGVISRVQRDGTCWVGGTTWFGEQLMRISVSNWSTSDEDIDRSAGAILDCYTVVLQRRE
jgi:glutamate/tyrosine decarboxylase-like PLP-dependent enzyme